MHYFVTGGTGFVGGHLISLLLKEGHQVTALVRDPDAAGELSSSGVHVVKGDITDKQSMREPMRGLDGVFHVAAWYKVGVDSSKAESINVGGTRNVFELVRELNISRVVYTSTLAVFSDTRGEMKDESYAYTGPHLTEYDRTKWSAHYEVALPMMGEGVPGVIVQPGVVYGPDDTSPTGDFLRSYLNGKQPIIPVGPEFCWAHVDDIARGHLLAMEKGRVGETYIIAGQRAGLERILHIAQDITGIKPPSIKVGAGIMKGMAAISRLVGKVVTLPSDYHHETLTTMASTTYLGTNEKAVRELGYTPRPLRIGLYQAFEGMVESEHLDITLNRPQTS